MWCEANSSSTLNAKLLFVSATQVCQDVIFPAGRRHLSGSSKTIWSPRWKIIHFYDVSAGSCLVRLGIMSWVTISIKGLGNTVVWGSDYAKPLLTANWNQETNSNLSSFSWLMTLSRELRGPLTLTSAPSCRNDDSHERALVHEHKQMLLLFLARWMKGLYHLSWGGW